MIHEPGELVSPNRVHFPTREQHSSGLKLSTMLNELGRPDIFRRTESVGVATAIGITIASVKAKTSVGQPVASIVHYVVFPLGIGWTWSENLEWRG